MRKDSTLVGIDEAGRGPLAGPIAVGAFAVKSKAALRKFRGVKDSKQLSEIQREEWFAKIRQEWKKGIVAYAVSFCAADVIDRHGISRATYSSLNRCLRKLEMKKFIYPQSRILLDGSLHASSRYSNQKTIIDGDSKEKIIALASICAKVLRDRKMRRLAREYPQYNLDIHKGYGTESHYRAIHRHGISPIHRKSFLKGHSH